MTTATEYRQFAKECIESARKAASEPIRAQFLELSRLWLRAAQLVDERDRPNDQNALYTDGLFRPTSGESYGQSS